MHSSLASFKKLKKLLKVAEWLESTTPIPANDGFLDWCQDETRMGLKTIQKKSGIKAISKVQLNFQA